MTGLTASLLSAGIIVAALVVLLLPQRGPEGMGDAIVKLGALVVAVVALAGVWLAWLLI